jgi:hypothetical protein
VLQFFGSLAARLLLRLPLIGALGGAFVGFRKIIQPWYVYVDLLSRRIVFNLH